LIKLACVTVRYDILTCAQKLTGGQLNPAHGTKNEKKKKLKTTTGRSEEKVLFVVRERSPRSKSETRGEGFVKPVGFKLGVKVWGSYG